MADKTEKKQKYRANFLWKKYKEGSIEEAGYEFANGNTEAYQKQWWKELLHRVREQERMTDTEKARRGIKV